MYRIKSKAMVRPGTVELCESHSRHQDETVRSRETGRTGQASVYECKECRIQVGKCVYLWKCLPNPESAPSTATDTPPPRDAHPQASE